MSADIKYREFWIRWHKRWTEENYTDVITDVMTTKRFDDDIHVIEYAAFEKLNSDLQIAMDALKKNKEEWEVVHPNGFKCLVAWQMCRDTIATLHARIDGYEKIEGEK